MHRKAVPSHLLEHTELSISDEGAEYLSQMDAANNVFNFPFCSIILMSTMGQEALGAIIDLRWMLAAILLLMAIDTAYSYAEHVKDEHRGVSTDKWSTSGALRRFGGKIGTYLSFLIIGCIVGLAFTEPVGLCDHVVTSAFGAGLGILCEIISIGGHYLHLRDIYVTLSPTSFIKSLIVSYVEEKSARIGKTLEDELIIEHKNADNKKRKPRRGRKVATATPSHE